MSWLFWLVPLAIFALAWALESLAAAWTAHLHGHRRR